MNHPLSGSHKSSKAGEESWISISLSSIGPGFVFTMAVLGTGDIVANTTAGAGYRYSLIWTLILVFICRFVWVNTAAKYVLVTGESLLTGYGRLGKGVVWAVLIFVIVTRHFSNMVVIVMTGSAVDLLLPLPTVWSSAIWATLFTLAGLTMMFWGGYPVIETFCKALVVFMGVSLVVAALLSDPDPVGILAGTFVPSLPQAQGLYSAVLIVMALIGTEAGALHNVSYTYFIREKGWTDLSYLKRQRVDLVFGIVCMFVMAALLQIAAAGTIHPLGVDVEETEDMARVFYNQQGRLGLIVFALGLWGASFSSLVGGSTGYGLILTDICRTFVPYFKQSREKRVGDQAVKLDPLFRAAVTFWCFSPLYIFLTNVRPVWLVLTVIAIQVVMIPLLATSLLIITNRKSLMGEHRNGWFTNLVMGTLVLLALYFTYVHAGEFWNSLTG